MAINPILFELAKQFGGSLVDEEDTAEKDRIKGLASRFGGEPVATEDAVPEEEPVRPSPSIGGTGALGLLSAPFGRQAVKETAIAAFQPTTYESIFPVIGESFDISKAKFGLAAVDALPNSIDTPPAGVPMEDIDRAGGVRQYYETFYGVKSDEELKELKQKTIEAIARRIKESEETISEITPEGLTPAQVGIRSGIQSVTEMVPGIAASVITRSPTPALASAAGLTGLESYGEARLAGKDPTTALAYGGIDAAIETATERFGLAPVLKILKKANIADVATKEEVKDALTEFAKREIGSEQAATALQTLNALAFGLDEELANAKSPEEAIRIQGERQFITAVATVVGGGAQGGAIAAANKIQENNIRKEIEKRTRDLEGVGSIQERKAIQELRDQALNDAQTISAPDLSEVSLEEGQTEPTPLQFADAYADRIFNSVGQYIPADVEFSVTEKEVDGETQYTVTDKEGRQYGQNLTDKDQADALSLSLNNIGQSRAQVLESLNPLYISLKDTLKGYGLNDIGLTLNDRIFTRRGEALTSEGLFDPVVREVFLAVDAIDPDGTLDQGQRRQALRGVLRHEVVHALRYLDLWKKSEWKNLENAVSRIKKTGTDKTYLDIAKERYGDQTPVIQVEEAVADLIRDVADQRASVAGKPRSLSERAVQFFDRAKNALTGAGFQTYEDIVNRFESGEIGARQRGKIRTFRASEEFAAEKGYVPERLQRILKSPEGRNQFREDTLQNLISSLPSQALAAPAMNSLRNAGIRESRSTIEQVPPKIKIDDQELPTRDSEGRLIYSGYEGPEVFNIQTAPTEQGLKNFWRWFGDSKAVSRDGRPSVYYHGTAADITAFRPKQAGSVFITKSPSFANEFAGMSEDYMVGNFTDFMSDQQVLDVLNETLKTPSSFPVRSKELPPTKAKPDEKGVKEPSKVNLGTYENVLKLRDSVEKSVLSGKPISNKVISDLKYIAKEGRNIRLGKNIQDRMPSAANLVPVYVKADNPFDYQDKDQVYKVLEKADEFSPTPIGPIEEEALLIGDWETIESSAILEAIKSLGFDSMYVEEAGQKNLAVFDPGQVKSAIGNNGEFSPLTPSIRESRQPTYNIVNTRTGKVVGQANTINGARRSVDRRDNQYGAYVHTIQVVDEEGDREQRAKAREMLGLPALMGEPVGEGIGQPSVEAGRAVPEAEAVVPKARESRKKPEDTPPASKPIGNPVPGPSTNVENTADAEALNNGRPVNSMGIATGPQVTTTDPETLEVDTSEVRLRKEGVGRLVRTLEFVESAPDRLRRGIGLEDLAKNVEDYYDTLAARLGFVNNIIRNAVAQIPLKDRYSFDSNIPGFGPVLIQGKALREFESFIRARENGRTDEAQFIRSQVSDSGRALIEAWEQLATETGRINLEIRTPYGKPLRVYDPNYVTGTYGEKAGGWRPIKVAPNFFPRTLRKEVLAVMNNPDSDPALFNQLMRSLVEAGKADDIDAARKWLLRSYFSEEIRSDYFAGVERARSEKLPEIFYDYSWDAVTRYLNKWAKRTSQVQYFGQELGQMPNQRDYFGRILARSDINEDTKAYILSIRDRIYEVDNTGDYGFILNWLNSIVTGGMLGNPISSSFNLIGGTVLNIAEFGVGRVGKAFVEYAKTPIKPVRSFVTELNANEFGIDAIAKAWKELKIEWAKVQEEGTTLGILNNDVINLLNDIPSEANKYFEDERTLSVGPISLRTAPISRGLAKSANILLTVGGYQKAENIVRYTALLAAKGWLNDSLKAMNTNPSSKQAVRFKDWIQRENLNLEKLLLENGIGEETARFFRRAVNVPQGSYKIDMTPVFVDTPVGRFLFKYQKFATQVNRYFYRHYIKPFKDKPDATNALRILSFLGWSLVGGELVLLIREAFGYGNPSADFEEITKALRENEDLARALALSWSRALQDLLAVGVFGFFGNYAQLFNDWQDQMRVKNPMSPPGAASIGNLADLINKFLGQKTLTLSDLDDYAQAQVSLYRAGKRITLATLDSLGSDAEAVKKFVTQKNLREVREFTDRYSEEMDIEYKRRIAPGAVIPTPQTPFNRRIVDALYRGNSAEAKAILFEAQAGKTREERDRIRRSAMSAVRNGQPIRIAGTGASDEDRRDFMRWAQRNLSADGYAMTYQMDFTYRSAARRADLGFKD